MLPQFTDYLLKRTVKCRCLQCINPSQHKDLLSITFCSPSPLLAHRSYFILPLNYFQTDTIYGWEVQYTDASWTNGKTEVIIWDSHALATSHMAWLRTLTGHPASQSTLALHSFSCSIISISELSTHRSTQVKSLKLVPSFYCTDIQMQKHIVTVYLYCLIFKCLVRAHVLYLDRERSLAQKNPTVTYTSLLNA